MRVLARDPAKARRDLPEPVQIVPGDLLEPESLVAAVEDARAIVFTAGIRSATYAAESQVMRTDFGGVLATIAAAQRVGFAGRFLYLNSIGIDAPSLAGTLLNVLKRNVFAWRRRAEERLRTSGVEYTIIRVGFLVDRAPGRREVALSQRARPLTIRTRIARADVAECFVAALDHSRTSRATFEIVWRSGARKEAWAEKFGRLVPDHGSEPPAG